MVGYILFTIEGSIRLLTQYKTHVHTGIQVRFLASPCGISCGQIGTGQVCNEYFSSSQSTTLKKQAARYSEMLPLYQITRRHI
jgi:hypothetical protein